MKTAEIKLQKWQISTESDWDLYDEIVYEAKKLLCVMSAVREAPKDKLRGL